MKLNLKGRWTLRKLWSYLVPKVRFSLFVDKTVFADVDSNALETLSAYVPEPFTFVSMQRDDRVYEIEMTKVVLVIYDSLSTKEIISSLNNEEMSNDELEVNSGCVRKRKRPKHLPK